MCKTSVARQQVLLEQPGAEHGALRVGHVIIHPQPRLPCIRAPECFQSHRGEMIADAIEQRVAEGAVQGHVREEPFLSVEKVTADVVNPYYR